MANDRDAQLIAAIKQYLQIGWAAIPLPAGSKVPVADWGQWRTERPGKPQWSEWWRQQPGCNLAVVYSSSAAPEGKQLVCVDTDNDTAEAWVLAQVPNPPTPTALTAKGRHRYFYAPVGLEHFSGDDQRPEIRAGAHYSILPPSLHPSGAVYEWAEFMAPWEVGVADLPGWGVALMGRPLAPQAAETPREQQEPVPEGRRNETLFRRCAKWRAADVPDGDLRRAAHAWNQSRCQPPLPEREVEGIVASVLRYAPGTSAQAIRPEAAEATPEAPAQAQAPEDMEALLRDAERAVNAAPGYEAPSGLFKGAVPLEQIAADVILSVDERRLLPKRIYGMRSGFRPLDEHFGGFKWQGLMLLSADSGAGKTTIARHCIFATADAIQQEGSDARLLVYILEGGREQFLRYFAAWRYGIPLWVTAPGSQDAPDEHFEDKLMRAYSEFPNLPIDLCDETRDADRILYDIETRAKAAPIEGVVLDNVQLLEYPRGGNEWANNKRTAMKALDLADKLQFPFLALSQINRSGSDWKERGGPEWRNNATAVFFAERGEQRSSREERALSNLTTLYNLKARYLTGCCQPLRLRGNRDTGRLQPEYVNGEAWVPTPADHDN